MAEAIEPGSASDNSLTTADSLRWFACSGCSGEVGVPLDWKEPNVECPKCGHRVELAAGWDEVGWRPHTETLCALASQPEATTCAEPEEPKVAPPAGSDRWHDGRAGDSAYPESPVDKSTDLGKTTTSPVEFHTSNAGTSVAGNGYAVTGLSLGIASIVLYWIGIIPILGIIFSGIGIAKANARQGQGRVKAWIGLVLSIIYTFEYMWAYGYFGRGS